MSRWGSKSVTFDDFALLSTKGIREEIEAFLRTGRERSDIGSCQLTDGLGMRYSLTIQFRRHGERVWLHYTTKGSYERLDAIEIVQRPCHFGGYRYYFVCSLTGRLCCGLRLVRGCFMSRYELNDMFTGANKLFYKSQTKSSFSRIWQQIRLAKRKAKERGISEDEDYWLKPKWMRYATFERLVNKVHEAEKKKDLELVRKFCIMEKELAKAMLNNSFR